jgi:hypothetical protein
MVLDDSRRSMRKSHLFTVRYWLETLGNGQTDWRGKVQYVNSGEVRYFRDCQTLNEFIETILQNLASDEISQGGPDKEILLRLDHDHKEKPGLKSTDI